MQSKVKQTGAKWSKVEQKGSNHFSGDCWGKEKKRAKWRENYASRSIKCTSTGVLYNFFIVWGYPVHFQEITQQNPHNVF
jgi:hypothetical protein